MDPDAVRRVMLDESNDFDTRCEAAINLLTWLSAGGYTPGGQSGRSDLIDQARTLVMQALDRVQGYEDAPSHDGHH